MIYISEYGKRNDTIGVSYNMNKNNSTKNWIIKSSLLNHTHSYEK